jgi:hypothetical protein
MKEPKIFSDQAQFYSELFAVWRIFLGVVVIQVIGGIFFAAMGYKNNLFVDLWAGAAFATPIGYVLGCIWQEKSEAKSLKKHKQVVFFMGVLSLTLLIAVLAFPLDELANSMKIK